MKCIACGKRTRGLPDNCPSCGAKLMAAWNDWYRYPLYYGLGAVFFGLVSLYYGIDDAHVPRILASAGMLGFGLFVVWIGVIMRGRVAWKKVHPE